MLTRLRHHLWQWLCPTPSPVSSPDPARMARLERRIAAIEQTLADPPSPPPLAVDMDAHLGAN